MSILKRMKIGVPRFLFEVAIIIVGILLSLLISNWAQGRKDHNKEVAYLRQIKAELEDDLGALNNDLEMRGVQLGFASATLQAINAGATVDLAELGSGIQQLVVTVDFVPNNVTFRSMESTGQLQLINNAMLTKGLMELYNKYYAALKLNNDDVTTYRNNFIVPYVVENIDMNGAMTGQLPANVEAILQDQAFTNHLIYNQISISSTQGVYKRTIKRVGELIALVEEELN